MERQKKRQLLSSIGAELQAVNASLGVSDEEVIEWSGVTRSQKASRLQAIQEAETHRERKTKLNKLKQEIESSSDRKCNRAEVPSYLEIEIDDGYGATVESGYLVEMANVQIPENLWSPRSEMGRAVLGKGKNEQFNYEVRGTRITGKVLDVK